ncbi:MAG: BNR-4 repeat-containing protein [Fibrobacteres bacterium]|nr:BNR-4 repeat-containing protein [Fibrobacterota bacterium]
MLLLKFISIIAFTGTMLFSQQSEVATVDGAWCWFTEPRSITFTGTKSCTYTGWVNKGGSIIAGAYNHASQQWDTTLIHGWLQYDDHANPSFMMWPDGRLYCFYGAHNDSKMRLKIMSRPEDMKSFGPMITVSDTTGGLTYPNPHLLTAEDSTIYCFFRGGGSLSPYLTKSADRGLTWSKAKQFINTTYSYSYFKFTSNGKDKIHFIFTNGHPNGAGNNTFNNIYYAYYYQNALYRANGTRIKSIDSLPLLPSEADKIYDNATNGAKGWVWELALGADGNPQIAYTNYPSTTDHRYRFMHWNGTSWIDQELTKAGSWFPSAADEPYYSGGITIDSRTPFTLYLSKPDPVTGVFGIERWRSNDQGSTWKVTSIIGGVDTLNVRPYIPRNTLPGLELFFMKGIYPTFTSYNTSIRMLKKVDTTTPEKVTGVNVNANGNFVSISWNTGLDAETAVNGYEIYRGYSTNLVVRIGKTSSLLYRDTVAAIDTQYFYAVKAVNVNGVRGDSFSLFENVRIAAPLLKSLEVKPDTLLIKTSSFGNLTTTATYSNNYTAQLKSGIIWTLPASSGLIINSDGKIESGAIEGTYPVVASIGNVFDTAIIIVGKTGILYDDFENGGLLSWIPKTPSRWALRSDSGDVSYGLITTEFAGNGDMPGEYSTLSGVSASQFSLNVSVRTTEALAGNQYADYTIMFGIVDSRNFYYMAGCNASQFTEVYRVVNGIRTSIANAAKNFLPDYKYHKTTINVTKDSISVDFDGVRSMACSATVSSGGIALGSFNDGAYFDDFSLLVKDSLFTDVVSGKENVLPALEIFPNPFYPSATLKFTAFSDGYVSINVYDLLGRKVKCLHNGELKRGSHRIVWNGKTLSSGLYVIKAEAKNVIISKRVLLTF